MRLIDANAAMKLLGGEVIAKYPSTFTMGILASVREIDNMPTIEQPTWISCAERLPEKGGTYLVVEKRTGVVGTRYYYQSCPDAFARNGTITHWMPLPQPPKGDE